MRQHQSNPSGDLGARDRPDRIPDAAVRRAHTALRHLRAQLSGPAIPAPELVKPLLDLWAAAYEVHPWVARPVEHYLSVLEEVAAQSGTREVPSSQVVAMADDVDLLLLEVRSLVAHAPSDGGTDGDVPVLPSLS